MHIHCLKNVATEGLGLIESWAAKWGHSIGYSNCYENPEYPDLNRVDLLVIAGGPMGVNDETDYPWLTQEKAFLKSALEQDVAILGICLGAQLLAHLLGARVYPNAHQEIGWMPVMQTGESHPNSPFATLPNEFEVMHWHGDTYELPEGAMSLAWSQACDNQAFLYGDRVFGLQFHIELTQQNLQQLCEAWPPVPDAYVQSTKEICEAPTRMARLERTMNQIMDAMAALVLTEE